MKASVGQVQLQLCMWLLLCGAAVSEQQYFTSSIPPPPQLHKFLFVLPTNLPSHVMTSAPIAVALAARGHEVHMLCDTPDRYKLPNVTCLPMGAKIPQLDEFQTFSCVDNSFKFSELLASAIKEFAKNVFSSPSMLKLYNARKQYDLVILDQMAMFALYPFAHETTFALLTTGVPNPCQSAEFGNPQNPIYVSNEIEHYPQPFSFVNRLKSFVQTIAFCFAFRYFTNQAELSALLPGLPSIVEVERNASLHFVTYSLALNGPIPLLPNQVPVGGLILRSKQPLPKDIAEFLDGEDPVVYLSFGVSFVSDETIDKRKKNMLISVLERLPYKVIFKIRGQEKKRVGNMLYHNDVPQQDILAHPNVKAFVSHCGLAGTQEAVYNAVPIIGFPAIWEHSTTASILEAKGVGIKMSWSTFTEESFENAVTEVITNPSYQRNMAALSRVFRDQPESPLDRAVFWSEYTARHKGAAHLHAPAKQLSWVQILAIDIICVLLLASYLGYIVIKGLYRLTFARSQQEKTKKNKLL